MSNLTVTLSDQSRDYVESRVAVGGYSDVSEYFQALIEEDRRRLEIEEDRRRLEEEAVIPLLREALDGGPAAPMTREDWDWVRREARERLAKRPG